jgi:hypothetical protein
MLMQTAKRVGDFHVAKAVYFGGGDVDKLRQYYVASHDDVYAHGDTVETSIRDLRFKIAQVNFNPSELIDRVKYTGVITRNDFRLFTGACESGLAHGLEAMGLPPDLDQMSIVEALAKSAGKYGGDKLRSAFSSLTTK